MSSTLCPCGSGHSLNDCCGRYHAGQAAPSAEALMRSRYSAYVLQLVDYLVGTTLPAQQEALDRESIRHWSAQSTWLGLEVKRSEQLPGNPEHAWVTFEAHWRDADAAHSHEERSAFVRHDQRWYFIDPTAPLKAGRNHPCPCGSSQKFKKCCAPYMA